MNISFIHLLHPFTVDTRRDNISRCLGNNNNPYSLYPPISSHAINSYRKMGPSISIPPSFHDKGPVPISPYPGLSPAK